MRPARREMRLKTFTFSATQDDVDDDGESVKLTFGTPLPARVSAGTVSESTVNIQSKTPLTASVESAPPSHNGSDEFRIRIAFSEEPKTGFSYKIMRDHAFTVLRLSPISLATRRWLWPSISTLCRITCTCSILSILSPQPSEFLSSDLLVFRVQVDHYASGVWIIVPAVCSQRASWKLPAADGGAN